MENKELSLEETQQESFKVLLKLKEIMEANNWNYCLAWGTLLGAVRHKGFIPWDDDIDIAMPRKDYEEFIQYCIEHKDELKPFSLLNSRTNDKYLYVISRFTDATNFKYVPLFAKDYNQGTFVDIYPIDECDEQTFEKQYDKLFAIIKRLARRLNSRYQPCKPFFKNCLKWLIWNCCFRWQSHRRFQLEFEKKVKKINAQCKSKDRCVVWGEEEKVLFYTEDFFTEKKELEFNGVMFRVPNNFDRILKQIYGDYMKLPPKEKRNPKHFYKIYRKK